MAIDPEITAQEEAFYDMSDEELEAAFKEAKAYDSAIEEGVQDTPIDEIEEEDVDTDLEQPDVEDSDDNTDTDDTDEPEEDDEPSATDDAPDEDVEEEGEDNLEDEPDDDVKEVQPVQTRKFKANGKEFELTVDEIIEQFPKVFGQAMDYTKKTQAIKPYRKMIDAWEQEGLTQEDLNLAIDVLKGDKNAITEVIKKSGVDPLEDIDLEADNAYTPNDYGRDDTALAIKDVVDEISGDREFAITQNILNKEWDDKSWNEMASNPQMIKLLHVDVKNGTFDRIQPIADKLKVFDGGAGTDLDYYKKAAEAYYAQQDREAQVAKELVAKKEAEAKAAEEAEKLAKVKEEQAKRKAVKATSKKRKAAAPTKTGAGVNTGKSSPTSYLDVDDDDWNDWYSKMVEGQ